MNLNELKSWLSEHHPDILADAERHFERVVYARPGNGRCLGCGAWTDYMLCDECVSKTGGE